MSDDLHASEQTHQTTAYGFECSKVGDKEAVRSRPARQRAPRVRAYGRVLVRARGFRRLGDARQVHRLGTRADHHSIGRLRFMVPSTLTLVAPDASTRLRSQYQLAQR